MRSQIDESAIAREIEARQHIVRVSEDWRTPSGNYRNAPMYSATIENEFLGLSKVVTARVPEEVRDKARNQLQQWAARELRERIESAKEDLRDNAAAAFLAAKDKKNASIRSFQEALEAGRREAIEEYVGMVFERSSYPKRLAPAIDVHFDEASGNLVADASVPGPADVPDVAGYKTADRNRSIVPIPLKARERDDLYDSSVKQLALRILHEIFEAVYTPHVTHAVVNVWTTIVDKRTGHDQTSCILSVSAPREQLESLNLARIDPTEGMKQLKGLIGGLLAEVAPVQPIMTFNRDDPRFIESREALAELNAITNLAEIPWEEFEHLVCELFAKMFSEQKAEVKVTRSTRDGGVDAVVFDPDPIRGGKFVIQAKRYTKPVPISAVRDLYGTMLNESAGKGPLVTTAHFGAQTRGFAKDKPISLIDGSNLIYLLEQDVHRVQIDIAGRPPEPLSALLLLSFPHPTIRPYRRFCPIHLQPSL